MAVNDTFFQSNRFFSDCSSNPLICIGNIPYSHKMAQRMAEDLEINRDNFSIINAYPVTLKTVSNLWFESSATISSLSEQEELGCALSIDRCAIRFADNHSFFKRMQRLQTAIIINFTVCFCRGIVCLWAKPLLQVSQPRTWTG
jgi:hypothetical protein